MELASFAEADTVLDKPEDMSRDECDPASVLRAQDQNGRPVVVSCWKITADELAEMQRTGRVWLVCYGTTMPPTMLCGVRPF